MSLRQQIEEIDPSSQEKGLSYGEECQQYHSPANYFCIEEQYPNHLRFMCAEFAGEKKLKTLYYPIIEDSVNKRFERLRNIAQTNSQDTQADLEKFRERIQKIFTDARELINKQLDEAQARWINEFTTFEHSIWRKEQSQQIRLDDFDPAVVLGNIHTQEGFRQLSYILNAREEVLLDEFKVRSISAKHSQNIEAGLTDLEHSLQKFRTETIEKLVYTPSSDFFQPFELNKIKGNSLKFLAHEKQIWQILQLDKQYFATVSNDAKVKVWDFHDVHSGLRDNKPFKEFLCFTGEEGHSQGVVALVKVNSEQIATAGHDGLISIFNWRLGTRFAKLDGHNQKLVKTLAVVKAGTTLVSAGEDRNLVFWDLTQPEIRSVRTIERAHTGKICCAIDVRSNILATTSEDKSIRLWDLNKYEELAHTKLKEDEAETIYPLDQNQFCTGTFKNIYVWSLPDLKYIRTISAHQSWILRIARADESTFLTASQDKSVKVWDWRSGKQLKELKGHSEKVFTVCKFGSDAVLSATKDGYVYIWQ